MRLLCLSSLLATTSIAAFSAAPALAQDDGRYTEQIIVTARQREESLQDVPASITAITAGTIKSAGIRRPEDFIQLTPGVTIVDTAEVGDTQVNIRGINGARDAENSFALIVDGILQTNPAALNRDYLNLRQIEILKGPQGALYGRNAAAGAIIITTAKPDDEFSGDGQVSYGNNNTVYVAAGVQGPLADGIYGRLSGNFYDTDGFFNNTFLNRDVVDNFQNFNIDGRLVFEIGDSTELDLKARYAEVDAAAISFNAAFNLPAFGGLNPDFDIDVNEYEFNFINNVVPTNTQETIEFSARVDHEMDWATLSVWGLYSDIDNQFLSDGTSAAFGFFNSEASCVSTFNEVATSGFQYPSPLFAIPGNIAGSIIGAYSPTNCEGYQVQARNQKDISFEVRLSSPGDQDLRWSVGGYFLDIDRQVGVATHVQENGNIINELISSQTEQLFFDDFDSTVLAAFGQLAYDITDEIEIAAAGRFDSEKRKTSSLVPTDLLSRFITPGLPVNPGIVNGQPIADQQRTFQQFQPKISINYEPMDELTLFASWGIGFKSGGFNNQGASATIAGFAGGIGSEVNIQDQFEKEKSSSFEAGFKSRLFDGRLSIDGAAYYTKTDDMQFFEFFAGPFGLLRVVSNIDETRIYGFELATSYAINDIFNVYGSVNVLDSKINANSSRPSTVGNEVPYAADYTINVGGTMTVPLSDDLEFTSRVDWQYIGPTWFHTVQAQDNPTLFGVPGNYSQTQRDGYGLLNLRAGLQGESWSVVAYADNVLRKEFLEEVIPAPEFGGSFVSPGDLRGYGIEATFSF